ncbi:MAG: hypothetical protein HWE22_10095 [Flavobacteriales bacterium]|nr:hypothetical protein [Flavobacteriales bacterium]
MADEFLKPRLTGKRFDDHTLPVELLSDFAALEELIIEIAKQKYRDANPDRQRVPRGFSDGVSLKLATIEEGSAIPGFILAPTMVVSSATTPTDDTFSYFEQARETVIQSIDQSERGETIELPAKYASYFNRIGKNLLPDECIEFNPTSETRRARLTKESRLRIVRSADVNAEHLESVIVIARVSELDKAKQSFTLENHSVKISGANIPSEHKEQIYQAFNEFEQGHYIRLKGIARMNASNKIVMIDTIEHMDLLDSGDIEVRLEQISALKDGWYYGEGVAYNPHQLNAFLHLFNQSYSNDLPNPLTFPTPEGKLQLEWNNDQFDASLTISLETLESEFHAVKFSDASEVAERYNLNESTSWVNLNEWLIQNMT